MAVDRDYLETFYEVVAYMHTNESEIVANADGTNGRVSLAIELTDKFQKAFNEMIKNAEDNCDIDISFYDEIDVFLMTELA